MLAAVLRTALAEAERTFDRAAREDDPAWLAYFDAACIAARMAQCFRDLGEAGHAARYAGRSLDMDGRYVRAFSPSLPRRRLTVRTPGNTTPPWNARLQPKPCRSAGLSFV